MSLIVDERTQPPTGVTRVIFNNRHILKEKADSTLIESLFLFQQSK